VTQERVLRRGGARDHILQLFDTADSLGTVVSAFLNEGWEAGEHLLIIARPKHWRKIEERMRRRGWSESKAIEQGRLTTLDAAAVVTRCVLGPVADGARFHETLGGLVARMASTSRDGLRIYCELMELLAEEGNFDAARAVETFWNELREQRPFTLLCGYSAAHFADARAAAALRAICACHTRVQRNSSDLLGSWLLADERAEAADAG
jgi:hypothetical protein